MEISVSDAKARLTDLVRRAEAGEEIVLTRFGRNVARLLPISPEISATERKAVLERVWEMGVSATPGPNAARSQDYLYDENGLPV